MTAIDSDVRPSDAQPKTQLGRRSLLKGALMGAGAAALPSSGAQAAQADGAPASGMSIEAGNGIAITETIYGKVAGYVHNRILTFKGMPYGDTTEGSNRWQPPKQPKPWTGIRSSRQYGYVAPQSARSGWANDEEAFLFQWNDGVQSEDCLRINVWTPATTGKRPVMVWLHGGGFTSGSGHELPSYDGENLARRGDVVMVSLNHRLSALGFLDLSGYGERFAHTANLGMLDIVAALEWVRDNIAAFGGDPRNVTIFGQSGGGAKVGTLMAMPSARGLFHRAIVQSGSLLRVCARDDARKLSDMVVKELGLSAATADRLLTVPYKDLMDVSMKTYIGANLALFATGTLDFRKLPAKYDLGPVLDGETLPHQPFDPMGPAISAGIPMIIGTTLNEFVNGINHPEYEAMTQSELEAKVEQMFPGKTVGIIRAFRDRAPKATPFDLWSRIADAPVRQAAIKQATAKAAQHKAPAYLYWFTRQTSVLDGRPRAFHCSELPYVFANTDRCENMTGGGSGARALSAKMADAWIQFARTGDPNHPAIPHWQPFAPGSVPTMVFDDSTELGANPDGAEQRSIA